MLFEFRCELENTAGRFRRCPAPTIEAGWRTAKARAHEGEPLAGDAWMIACRVQVDAVCDPLPGLLLSVSVDLTDAWRLNISAAS